MNYKKVTVTVTPQTSRARAYSQTTLVAPPAIGAISGKSTIIVTVIDALTDQPVAGAPVTADLSTSPTQTRTTGADGKVVFAGLEPSAIPVNDPKYKYRLTVGLVGSLGHPPGQRPGPRPAAPDGRADLDDHAQGLQEGHDPGQRPRLGHGPADRRAHGGRGQHPGPDVLSESQTGYTGAFTFATIASKAIPPSASNFTVTAQPDCYASGAISRPVPAGYPNNTTEVFDFSLARVPSGYLDVTVRSTAAGNPVIGSAQVQVSGGQANIAPRVRDTDAAGFARFCLEPSGTASYVVSAARAGYGAGSILATVNLNQTTPLHDVPGARADHRHRSA